MKHISRLLKHFCWISLMLLLGGCPATIPEIKPFADKTAEMASAMNKGYAQTEVSLTQADDSPDVNRLQEKWGPTKKALGAVVAYSDSLAAIADAGNKGSDSAKAVATSLNSLIAAVNPLVGLAQLPEQAVKTMEVIYGYVAKVMAREDMAKAVEQAQPAINQIAEILAKNFDDLEGIYATAGAEQERMLLKPNQEIDNYHRSLTRQRQIVTTTLINILDYQNADPRIGDDKKEALQAAMNQDTLLEEAIQHADQCRAEHIATCKDTASIVEDRQNQLQAKWRALQAELDRIAPEYNAYIANEAALKNQITSGRLVIKKSREAILVWRDTHAQIKGTLERKQRMTIQELAVVINDMVDVYKKGDK